VHLCKQTCRAVKREVDTAGMEPNFLNDDMTPYHIFELFWDVNKHSVNMTDVYAAQKGNANFQVTADELQWVLAILLISGYISLPSHRMFGDKPMTCRMQQSLL